jgi:ligand-binding sensor domain-containing protein/serine phosphatase RsbU (regulator of sigma subunit)
MKRIHALILLVSLSCLSYGQTFRFNQYTTEDGISQDFIYTINQDDQGYLWVGTGEGICRFDGKHFVTYKMQDGLVEDVVTSAYMDKKGTQWFGHNGGGITQFKSGKFSGIENQTLIESKINGISGSGNSIFGIAQNNGLFEIVENTLVLIGDFGKESFHAVQCIDDTNILLGTSEGLLHLVKENSKWKLENSYRNNSWVSDLSPSLEEDVYLMATQEGSIFKVRLSDRKIQFSSWDSDVNYGEAQIQSIMEDSHGNIWLGTFGGGLIKLHTDTLGSGEFEISKYNTSTGMSSDFVQSVFQDREGNIWVGTFGSGLSTLIDDFFTFYSYDEENYGNSVSAIWIDGNEKWYGVSSGIFRLSSKLDSSWAFYDGSNGFVNDKVTDMFWSDSILWIGTADHGMYTYNMKTEEFSKILWDYGSLQNKVNQITGDKYSIYVATEGGLIVYFKENNSTNLFDTQVGLAHNSIKTVCIASDETIWMGTHSRFLYGIRNSEIDEFEITNGGELEITAISEDLSGNIWIATAENGVYKKVGESFSHYSTAEGLKSNYTYAVSTDANGNIWVGHRGGLSKIVEKEDKVIIYGHKSGIGGQVNPRTMFLDDKNYFWIGTDDGAIKYDHSKDRRKEVAPVINLLSVLIGEKEYPVEKDIKLPYDNYRVQFNFIGISFKNPDKVKYKYMLEGYDQVYSDFTHETFATYGRLSDGKYTFHVMACTEDGTCTEHSASIKISITKPFWKQIWFYFLVAVVLIGSVILIFRIRVRRLQANQIYLEEQLAIKTKEVVEKADIIQEINKDMTASINYAERIQSAILPTTDQLLEKFPESFIFFRPRDIVSGDFYFMRHYKDKMIVACVDCTGHGVPGAFMSMIGSTTLRNIYKLMDSTGNWMKPDEVLDLLDEEIQRILHQRTSNDMEHDFFKSRDGMDMTLCEIDLKTNEIYLSSAKRHSIIVQNNTIEILSGDKRPIGGGEIDVVDFTCKTFQMKKGDSLFLFSDGYSDQFGGPTGRKLKLSGVKSIVENMLELDRSEYGKTIEDSFDSWSKDNEQIDDVLMIGLQF